MKYLLFSIALMVTPMVSVVLIFSRQLLSVMGLLLPLPMLLYDQTTINFFSEEWYRGTVRGMEVSLVYLACAGIFLALLLTRRLSRPLPDLGSKIYLIYFGWCCLSLYNADASAFPSVAHLELWKMAMMFLVFWTTYSYLCAVKTVFPLLDGIGILIVCCFLMVLWQHSKGIYQPGGFFPHRNSMAMFMGLATPVYYAHFLLMEHNWRWKYYIAVLFCGFVSLLRSYSRGAILFIPVGLAITTLLCGWYRFRIRILTRLLPLIMLGFMGSLLLLPRIIERFKYAPEASENTRRELALVALRMMQDKPFFGVGINNWGIKINPPYQYWEGIRSRRKGANYKDGIVETVYLLVGAECGVVGLLLLLLWYLYYLFKAFQLCHRLRKTNSLFLAAGFSGGLTVIYLQSAFEWVLKQSMNYLEFMFCMAILAYLGTNWKKLRLQESRGDAAS